MDDAIKIVFLFNPKTACDIVREIINCRVRYFLTIRVSAVLEQVNGKYRALSVKNISNSVWKIPPIRRLRFFFFF